MFSRWQYRYNDFVMKERMEFSIDCNYSGHGGKGPKLMCLRVLRARKHINFGNFPNMAKQ